MFKHCLSSHFVGQIDNYSFLKTSKHGMVKFPKAKKRKKISLTALIGNSLYVSKMRRWGKALVGRIKPQKMKNAKDLRGEEKKSRLLITPLKNTSLKVRRSINCKFFG